MEHVIVCGLGQVGYRVTTLLVQMGKTVTVITKEARKEFEREIAELGVTIISADARDSAVLDSAGARTANALITVTDSDLTNLEISLDVQVLNPNLRVIARLFDQTLAKRLENSVGIHRALAMSVLAAPSFAAAAVGSDVIGAFDLDHRHFAVHQLEDGKVEVRQTSPARTGLTGHAKHKIRFDTFLRDIPGTLKWILGVIAVLSFVSIAVFCAALNLSPIDSIYFVVTTLTTTGYGDITVKDTNTWVKLYTCLMMILGSAAVATLYSIITDYLVSRRFDEILGRQQVTSAGHVIVVGIGNVGFRIAEALDKMGYSVVAIDSDSNTKHRALLPENIIFVAGDGRDDETLELAGVDLAISIIACTHDDAVNLSACLMAKGLNPEMQAVVRLFDGEFARKVERALDIDQALSASRISAPGFVGAALYETSVFSFVTGDEFVTVIPKDDEFEFVRSKFIRPLQVQS